jgi:putative membrane protein
MYRDAVFREAVTAAVTRAEERTDAELVVVAAGRSGSYLDVALWVGVGLAMVVLAVLIYGPWDVDAALLPLDIGVPLALGVFGANRSPRLLRLLTPRRRQDRQVATAAHAAFVEEQVHGTKRRTGVLVYISDLERRVHVVPDHGVEACVPPGEWNRIRWDAKTVEGVVAGLDAAAALLSRCVPALADNPDEIPNAPRIRS